MSGYQNSHKSRNVALKTLFSIPFFFMLKGPTFCRSHYFYINISEVPTIYSRWQQKSLNFNCIKNLSSCLIPIHPVCQNLRSRLFATSMVCQIHSNKADTSFFFFFSLEILYLYRKAVGQQEDLIVFLPSSEHQKYAFQMISVGHVSLTTVWQGK